MNIRAFQPEDEDEVIELWKCCGLVVPWNDPHKDIQRKFAEQPDLLLVAELTAPASPNPSDRRPVVATVMVGYDGHRGWINYLAVHPDHRRTGIGYEMMAEAEKLLRARGCPKINLQVRATNADVIRFYENTGFITEDIINMGKRLEPDG